LFQAEDVIHTDSCIGFISKANVFGQCLHLHTVCIALAVLYHLQGNESLEVKFKGCFGGSAERVHVSCLHNRLAGAWSPPGAPIMSPKGP
jgi:hypothetical protein